MSERAEATAHFTQAPARLALSLLDCDLRFVAVNDAAAEINGVPAEEHRGRLLARLASRAHAGVAPDVKHAARRIPLRAADACSMAASGGRRHSGAVVARCACLVAPPPPPPPPPPRTRPPLPPSRSPCCHRLSAQGKTVRVLPGPAVLCPRGGPACRVTASLNAAGVQAGRRAWTLRPGATSVVSVPLTKAAAAALRRAGSATYDVTVTAAAGKGAPAAFTKVATVAAPS